MSRGLTVTKHVHFKRGRASKKTIREGKEPPARSVGKVPRISRLMALAVRMRDLIDQEEVVNYADLARLAHVSRARITQIMNLLHLAPDIQEEILFLPETDGGRAPISERIVRPIAAIPDWNKQHRAWAELSEMLLGNACDAS